MSIQSLGVHIKVQNFEKSKEFYLHLGFKPVFSYGPDQEVKEDYRGMTFKHGTSSLEIAEGHRAVKPEIFQEKVTSSKLSLMIAVPSLMEVIEACHTHKINIAVQPRHYYWGTLELVIKDPDGVVVVFITPYSKEEAEKIQADEQWATKP